MIALMSLVLTTLLAEQSGPALYSRVVLCCSPRFSREKALAKARELIDGRVERVKLLYLTNDEGDVQRPGGSHQSYEQLRNRLHRERSRQKQLAMFLETPDGSAIEAWNSVDGGYERVVISGRNPFRLSDSADLLGLTEDALGIHAYVASRTFGDTTSDASILRRLASWFPGYRVVVTIGESPTYSEALFNLPITPALAGAWAPEREPLVRAVQIRP